MTEQEGRCKTDAAPATVSGDDLVFGLDNPGEATELEREKVRVFTREGDERRGPVSQDIDPSSLVLDAPRVGGERGVMA